MELMSENRRWVAENQELKETTRRLEKQIQFLLLEINKKIQLNIEISIRKRRVAEKIT
jgi:hypothetical protein